ncbi:MAG TPA: hypothetical protein PKX84_08500, partial [Bacteroidia bacterium]|nr:hypothetical protein [Bacteroidia bacterium]
MRASILLTVNLVFTTFAGFAQWSTTTVQSARSLLAATSIQDKAMFGGGIGMISVPPPALDIYTQSTNQWMQSQISQGRTSLAAASTGNWAIFGGGANDWILSTYNRVDIYNGTVGSWTDGDFLSVNRAKLAAAGAGSKILFAGGEFDMINAVYDTVDIFDTLTQSWSTSALSVARFDLAGASAGNKILFAGGEDLTGTVY